MNSDFPRILTLLRKEKGVSQKSAAEQLLISQALLSHYEKGIRECGLDFLVRCADFYGVSCDYLLGRTPDRKGSTLTVDDIPDPDEAMHGSRENMGVSAVLPVLNKKLIANSQNILFDILRRVNNKSLTSEVSAFLMLAVYRMIRILHSANPKNQDSMFGVLPHCCPQYADAAMQICEANAGAVAKGQNIPGLIPVKEKSELIINTEMLAEVYPLYASSMLNLIQNAESRVEVKPKGKK
ncbi:MAG: helix-turn-helix transcriptional regulator [Oscillospiraceae bacterium]|nr:helix-turn-helix transcriptional regulator [Oscillospiraceae bacterium]